MTDLFLRPGDVVEFTPTSELDKPEAARVVYELRAPVLYDRLKLNQAVKAQGGVEHGPGGLLNALRRDCEELMQDNPEAERAEVLAVIDDHREGLRAYFEKMQNRQFDTDSEEGRRAFIEATKEAEGTLALARIQFEVMRTGRFYAMACAQDDAFNEFIGGEAARMFVVGWQNGPGDFARGPGGLSDAFLFEYFPRAHLVEIGAKVRTMLRLSEDAKKNLDGPSSGASKKKPSTALKQQRKKTH